MNEKQVKRERRVNRQMQRDFKETGLFDRVEAATREMFAPSFKEALRGKIGIGQDHTAYGTEILIDMARALLVERGLDLAGVTINVAHNEETGGLILQADASFESVKAARENATRKLALGVI